MENDNKICALIRQTWYETAKRNLSPSDRLLFYELCFEYEFYDTLPSDEMPMHIKIMFDLVAQDIKRDKDKAERRAERNRENGAKGGRPKVTEDNKNRQNPVGFLGYSGLAYTNTYNTTQHNTTKDNNVYVQENTHIFFEICLIFFLEGVRLPVDEARKFWNYYEATGWVTKNGQEVRDRVALARVWKCTDLSVHLAKRRVQFAALVQSINAVEPELLQDFVREEIDAKKWVLVFTDKRSAETLEYKYIEQIAEYMKGVDELRGKGLQYSIMQTELDM